jgi:hypothetical protein
MITMQYPLKGQSIQRKKNRNREKKKISISPVKHTLKHGIQGYREIKPCSSKCGTGTAYPSRGHKFTPVF